MGSVVIDAFWITVGAELEELLVLSVSCYKRPLRVDFGQRLT